MARRFPNTESRRHGSVTRYRARIQVLGLRKRGPWRSTPEKAFEDVLAIKRGAGLVGDAPLTLGAAVELRLSEAKSAGVAASTFELYEHLGGRFTDMVWTPDTPLSSITTASVVAYVARCRDKKPPRHVNTVLEKDLVFLASLFRVADVTPCPVQAARKKLKSTLKRVARARFVFAPEEVGIVLERVRSEPLPSPCPERERHADIFTLVAYTGIRSAELTRVQVRDIRDGILFIEQAKDSSNPRAVPLASFLEPVIDRLLDRCVSDPEALIIPGGMNYLRIIVRRWQDRLHEPRIRLRTFRHSFVTTLLQEGVPPAQVMFLAGHKNLSTTMRYLHELEQKKPDAIQTLERAFATRPKNQGGAAPDA